MRIAISGPPGSGKTTLCALVAKKLGLESILVGQLFRQMALEREVDLATFGRMAEEDETIDKELDDRILLLARSIDNLVIEGRLAGPILKSRKVPVFAVYIDAPETVRSARIAERERKPADSVLREMRVRERSERKRYMAYYGIDPSDRGIYDLWIDSGNKSPEEIAEIIVQKAKAAESEHAAKV